MTEGKAMEHKESIDDLKVLAASRTRWEDDALISINQKDRLEAINKLAEHGEYVGVTRCLAHTLLTEFDELNISHKMINALIDALDSDTQDVDVSKSALAQAAKLLSAKHLSSSSLGGGDHDRNFG